MINSLYATFKKSWFGSLLPKSKMQILSAFKPSSILAQQIQILNTRADNAQRYMQNNTIVKMGYQVTLDVLPWYIMIGPKGSGKSSLLQHANTPFIAGKKKPKKNNDKLVANVNCDWWITEDAVIIDVPGGYAPNLGKKPSVGADMWEYFLNLVRSKQHEKELGGVIITVSCLQLLDKKYRNHLVEYLKSRILELQNKFGANTPFYFAISKIDLLPGFAEFFRDTTHEEMAQAWGVTMPDPGVSETLSSLYIKRFNALIKVLNSQVVTRLHHERDVTAKARIKGFPLHAERVKDEFASVLNTLSALGVKFCMRGIYLNSVMQSELSKMDEVHCKAIWAKDETFDFMALNSGKKQCKAYFTKQFLLQGILV